jgi:serine protease Do
LTLDVFRANQTIKVNIKPGEFSEPTEQSAAERRSSNRPRLGLGLKVQALTKDSAAQFEVDVVAGVIVSAVDQDSPAARKGLKPGDIITAINQQSVANPKQYSDALSKADLKKGVLVNFLSGSTALYEILKERND